MELTYITPKIPRSSYEDWNPGHGLCTIKEEAAFIRHTYRITQIELIGDTKTIRLKVTGPEDGIRAFAALYGH